MELDGGARVGVLHGVVEQVVQGRHELAAVAEDREVVARLGDADLDALLLGGRTHALDRLGDHEVHGHRLARRCLLGLDAAELEQVVDGAPDAERLGQHPLGQPAGDRGVVLGEQRLGQQRQRADRRLQLVADVGHEVAAHRFEPAAVGDVVDDREPADGAAVVVERHRRDDERAPGRAEQVERPPSADTLSRLGEQLVDGGGHERLAVP